ncbi:DUF1028 domain-containing protein [Herpetosiphon llansteffanensis]|uniref:DUF1028 domain-containing protein n=1 Tax=Herpetosiphon llansteffanensis TaxID=2094568 RepID=UPI000D7BD67B|nr:DUF1028 domain-containing protein [Herpetosiphon llansteffanensis]
MTYSIVARDSATGELGVAIQSAVLSVGSMCIWAEAGVGAVATQSLLRSSHGPSGLTLMRNGHSATEAVHAVLAGDSLAATRQLGMVDATGTAHAWTGATCIRAAGDVVGDHFAVQANMMASPHVPEAMAAAFTETQGPLVGRLLAALHAAQAHGGDVRGQQSAALKLVSGTLFKNAWEGTLYDLRIDDHPHPVAELARLCTKQRALHGIGEAYRLAYQEGDMPRALACFHAAAALDPSDAQMQVIFALELATTLGQYAHGRTLLMPYLRETRWQEYVRRMGEARFQGNPTLYHAIETLLQDAIT